ncbi:T9SS type A sorting domain-containing protein [Aestuariivivens sediminicola]|uniref:T9SS type A sorting domain-containing protein n=1 Tax=Aestuariivivens sediminicola TaxID=2913560 RepID=UPI001F59C0E3|nr:T9SS type A sorting domain-containing protein [Aestuariivivens sediminicola]
MNKTTKLALLLLCSCVSYLNAQSAKQGFENKTEDNWTYTSNIPFYSNSNSTDIWMNQPGANGRIPGPFAGKSYLAGRDLDNPYSEGVTGSDSPEHILTFNAFAINGLPAEIAFRVHYVGLNKNDYIYYELRYDNGNDWSYSDYREDVFKTDQSGNFNSTGWEEITYNIPSGQDYVRMRLVVYQNGNEYLGFDDFELKTATLSNKHRTIEGFAYGPNPTSGVVRFSAYTILDEVAVYNVLGKEIIRKKGGLNTMTVDLTHVPSGVYLTQIKSGDISQTLKLIKR